MERIVVVKPTEAEVGQAIAEQQGLTRLMADLEEERQIISDINNSLMVCQLAQSCILESKPEDHLANQARADKTIQRLKHISASLKKLLDLPDQEKIAKAIVDHDGHLGAVGGE